MTKPNDQDPASSNLSFESLKKVNQYGVEYWSARDLQPCLGYTEWRKFEYATKKAIKSCEQSGSDPKNHFVGADKVVGIGSRTGKKAADYHLSRFACYLIIQNGDPKKPEIAQAQKYLATQTRKQKISDQDAGYKGLYGGLGVEAIKSRKGISPKEQLMDRMHATELAANLFRITQTKEKLKNEGIRNQRDAIEIYEMVGKKVRVTIEKLGGTLPENLSPAEPIKAVKKRIKTTQSQLPLKNGAKDV